MKVKWHLFLVTSVLFTSTTSLESAYLFKNGRFVDVKDMAYLSLEDHYNLGVEALKQKKWDEAIHQFRIITVSFPETKLANDAHYFLGLAYFETEDLDLANQQFNEHLNASKNPTYFLQVFKYKFLIAERFQNGEKARLFHHEKLPKWRPAKDDALAIYDEIIHSLTNNKLAAKALFNKGLLQRADREHKEAIESFQTIIKRFPKSDMSLKAYHAIANTYLDQCQYEIQNSDILGLAEMNFKKFKHDFPNAPDSVNIAQCIQDMKDIYAISLFETAELYERKGEPTAAVIYYYTTVNRFPESHVAEKCRIRLQQLQPVAQKVGLKNVTP